jgi:hypothetical protein
LLSSTFTIICISIPTWPHFCLSHLFATVGKTTTLGRCPGGKVEEKSGTSEGIYQTQNRAGKYAGRAKEAKIVTEKQGGKAQRHVRGTRTRMLEIYKTPGRFSLQKTKNEMLLLVTPKLKR